jgi:YD repeat-containing protein
MCITLGFRASNLDRSDLSIENFEGKVKKVVTYNKEYGGDSAISSKWVSHYNIQGNTSEYSFYYIREVEKLFMSGRYTYDTHGRKISTSNELGEVICSSVYGYNSKHNLTERIYFRPDKHASLYIVYNRRNARDSLFSYDSPGKFSWSAVYAYDTEGNLIEETTYKSDGATNYKTLAKYDSNHHKLQEAVYSSKGKDRWATFRYDDNGNVIMVIDSNEIRSGGGPGIIPIHNIGLHGSTKTFIYNNFDKAGNWLENQELINGVLFRTNKREIEYY